MREILFRGKRVSDGEWVYGYYIKADYQWHKYGIHKDWIAEGASANGGWFVLRNRYAVKAETVGQYTGLTDKNGKKIFEEDILRHHNGHPDSEIIEMGVVFWDEKYCGWRRTSNGVFHHGVVDTYRLSPDCVYEIIGNIHDNPELIGGTEDGE